MNDSMTKMHELVAKLNRYSDEYYNGNSPTVTDAAYDRLFDELKALEVETGIQLSNSPTRRVGHPIVSGLKEVHHDIPLLSLDKTKSIEVHGDIGISVLSADLSEEIASFSYRNGHRPIDDDKLKELIPDDRALRNLDSAGRIYWSNNNWVEFMIFDENDQEVTSILCEDTVLDDDVLEVFDDISWCIELIKRIPSFGRETAKPDKMNKEVSMDTEKKIRDENKMSKKGNMAYWDSIEQLTEDYVRQLIAYSTKPIDFSNGDDTDNDEETAIMEIGKEVTEFTYKLLESQYGAEFPYVDEDY